MSSSSEEIVVYGASGFAVSIAEMLEHGFESFDFRVVAYIDDFRGDRGDAIDGVPVINFDRWAAEFRALTCMVTVGDPAARRRLAARVTDAGGRVGTVCQKTGSISPRTVVGAGTLVASRVYIGPFTVIGACTIVMPMAVLGHDIILGDCVTICSSASIAGHVVIEDDVFVGAGAVIVNGTPDRPMRIGRGTHVAAGAVVTKSLPAGSRVFGNPARDIRRVAGERLAARRRG